MKPNDSHEVSQLNEMKIDNTALNMIAGWLHNGDTIMVEQMPIFGGYIGGVEETAICDVATTLTSFTLLNASYHLDGPIHIRWGITTAKETLTIAANVAAAIDMNTDLLIANQYYPIAGPCTEMCLLETAAQAMVDTASGRELVSGCAAAKGVAEDYTTGMEARMMGEAAMATAGMKIDDVNKILDNLVRGYQKSFPRAPQGKRFQECYNVKKILPNKEYLEIYDKTCIALRNLGLDIQ
jgi:methylamine---corrinoid protein Co-methyltransferase